VVKGEMRRGNAAALASAVPGRVPAGRTVLDAGGRAARCEGRHGGRAGSADAARDDGGAVRGETQW
jgi:hypothetical protein